MRRYLNLAIAAVVFACAILILLVWAFGGRSNQQAQQLTVQPTALQAVAVAAPTEPSQPTAPPEPTATAAPTTTPAPTETPAPTDTPTAEPSPTSPPQPVVLQGSGQTVTDPFDPPSPLSRVTFTHQGQRNFIVTAYLPDGKQDGMVNVIGSYAGSRPLFSSQSGIYFEIKADGPWAVTIEALTPQPDAAQGVEGSGDFVSGLFQPVKDGPVPYDFVHQGQRNFIVFLHCAGGSDGAQNEIGPVNGSAVVQFSEGPCVWDVRADGQWSIKPK